MHIYSADFALEWTRPLPPHVKFVGPLLPQPPKPLPAELEVGPHCILSRVSDSSAPWKHALD